jgi:hypothetical protein
MTGTGAVATVSRWSGMVPRTGQVVRRQHRRAGRWKSRHRPVLADPFVARFVLAAAREDEEQDNDEDEWPAA